MQLNIEILTKDKDTIFNKQRETMIDISTVEKTVSENDKTTNFMCSGYHSKEYGFGLTLCEKQTQ